MTEIVVRVCLTAEVVPEVPEAVPAEEETARIEEVAVPASDVVEAAVAAAVPAAPEAAPIEEAAAPVTEVMVAVSADATPAEEEVSIEETTAPVIDVAAPEVVPSAPALDAAGLSVCVCARACVCVHVCVCVCVCVRVHMHESESFSFSFRCVPVSLFHCCFCPSHSHAPPSTSCVSLSKRTRKPPCGSMHTGGVLERIAS